MGDAGVMPAVDHKVCILPGGQADSPLGTGDGGRGLDGRPQDDGHPVGDAPQDAAGVVGLRHHPAVLLRKGVVVLGAVGPGGSKAIPELHALHGGDAEERRRQPVLHPAEHRISQPGGHPRGRALDDAAHGVQVLPGLQDQRLHPLPGLVVQHREGLGGNGFKQLPRGTQGEGGIPLRAHGPEVGPHVHAPAGQNLPGDAAGDAQGRRQPAGEVAAAPHVRLTAPLDEGGVVRVAGPGLVPEFRIIQGVLVAVFDDGAQRRAAGDAVLQAGEKHRNIGLLPGGGQAVLAGPAPVQEAVQFLQVDSLPGGQAVYHHADGLSMGLAEHRNFQEIAEFRGHGCHLPGSCRPPRNPGRIFAHTRRPAPSRGRCSRWRRWPPSWRSGGHWRSPPCRRGGRAFPR